MFGWALIAAGPAQCHVDERFRVWAALAGASY
jgi:hypothetical protein